MFTLVLMLACLIYTSCSKEGDLLVADESNTSTLAKSLYFYGSDAEFEQLQGVEMTHITTEGELRDIIKVTDDPYALFVGNDIDVRTGLVDNLRNSGILVTQLEEEIVDEKVPSANRDLIKGMASHSGETIAFDMEKNLGEDLLFFTTYLSVNGEHKILGSTFETKEKAVAYLFEWDEKNMVEESKEAITSKSDTSVNMNWNYTWGGLANFSIDTEVSHRDTDGYYIMDGIENLEYPDMFIYDHNISAISTNNDFRINDMQIIQTAYSPPNLNYYDHSLREYYPVEGDNEVLNGRTGSDSFGYGFNFSASADLSGPGISSGGQYEWTNTNDWSIPASEVKVYHD